GDGASGFVSVIDLITMRARTWDAETFGAKFEDGPIPHALLDDASRAREKMIEAIAEHDDELMAAWVSGRELSIEQLRRSLRRVTLNGHGVPTLVGAAYRNQGIHNLLDAVLDYLPSPADVHEIRGQDLSKRTITVETADKEPLAALAFKV